MSDLYDYLESEGINFIGFSEESDTPYEQVDGYEIRSEYQDDRIIEIINRQISPVSERISTGPGPQPSKCNAKRYPCYIWVGHS